VRKYSKHDLYTIDYFQRSGPLRRSSITVSFSTDDGSSILRDATQGESSKTARKEKVSPPLIIHDGKEPAAMVEYMPSVLHLPDPQAVPLPEIHLRLHTAKLRPFYKDLDLNPGARN
jgi:hypothetical protein